MAKVKCPCCGDTLEREDGVPFKNRYYHESCFYDSFSEDEVDKHFFYLRFQDIFGRTLSNQEWTQCSRMIKEGWTWNKLENVLDYVYRIEGKDDVDEYGAIGILPFYELKAKQFFIMKWNADDAIENIDEAEEEEVVVKCYQYKRKQKERPQKDLDKLLEDNTLWD